MMAAPETEEIQAKEKQEVTAPAEQTTPGPVFTPAVDIFETDKQITLLADLPGRKQNRIKELYHGKKLFRNSGYFTECIGG